MITDATREMSTMSKNEKDTEVNRRDGRLSVMMSSHISTQLVSSSATQGYLCQLSL